MGVWVDIDAIDEMLKSYSTASGTDRQQHRRWLIRSRDGNEWSDKTPKLGSAEMEQHDESRQNAQALREVKMRGRRNEKPAYANEAFPWSKCGMAAHCAAAPDLQPAWLRYACSIRTISHLQLRTRPRNPTHTMASSQPCGSTPNHHPITIALLS